MIAFTTNSHLFIITFSFGVTSILAGFIMLKFPPKKINGLYGYRTSNSMKNQKSWDFAQIYSAKEIIKIGVINILLSSMGFIFNPTETTSFTIGIAVLVMSISFLLFRVENAIQRNFNEG